MRTCTRKPNRLNHAACTMHASAFSVFTEEIDPVVDQLLEMPVDQVTRELKERGLRPVGIQERCDSDNNIDLQLRFRFDKAAQSHDKALALAMVRFGAVQPIANTVGCTAVQYGGANARHQPCSCADGHFLAFACMRTCT